MAERKRPRPPESTPQRKMVSEVSHKCRRKRIRNQAENMKRRRRWKRRRRKRRKKKE